MEARDHRARARAALAGNWVSAVLVYFVAGLIIGDSESSGFRFNINLNIEGGQVSTSLPQELQQFLTGTLGIALPMIVGIGLVLLVVRIALGGVLELGRATYSMNLIDGSQAEFADLFTGFHRFYDALIMNVLAILAVIGGFLLFVIPGVMLSCAYAMAPYILAENPDISGVEALRRSRQMMKGHKWELFWLGLTFIGWSILASFVPILGSAVVGTYKGISQTSFYRDLQSENRWNQVENF